MNELVCADCLKHGMKTVISLNEFPFPRNLHDSRCPQCKGQNFMVIGRVDRYEASDKFRQHEHVR